MTKLIYFLSFVCFTLTLNFLFVSVMSSVTLGDPVTFNCVRYFCYGKVKKSPLCIYTQHCHC